MIRCFQYAVGSTVRDKELGVGMAKNVVLRQPSAELHELSILSANWGQ
jgi:hypothetical protein